MRTLILASGLLLLVAAAGSRDIRTDVSLGGSEGWRVRSSGSAASGRAGAAPLPDPPLFSFASSTAYNGYAAYAGLPGANGCYSSAGLTSTKGAALTFTRATSRGCLSDDETSVTTCASGEVCMMANGIDLWRQHTNNMLRNTEMNTTPTPWTTFASGVAAPTITANAAVAPDGTTTAERFQFPATSSGQATLLYQNAPTLSPSTGIWIKGNGTSGTIRTILHDGAYKCKFCSYNASTWTLCKNEHVIQNHGSATFHYVGNDSLSCDTTAAGAQDVFIWGYDTTAQSVTAPFLQTTGAAVTANADQLSGSVTIPASPNTIALRAGYRRRGGFVASAPLAILWFGASSYLNLYVTSSGASSTITCDWYNGSSHTAASVQTLSTTEISYAFCRYDGTTKYACVDGVCNSSAEALTMPNGAATIYIGRDAAGTYEANGTIHDVCVDTNSTLCGATP